MPEPITVLGIGNPIMSDDGGGLEILEQLRAHYTDQQHLEFVDGGTSGMELLPPVDLCLAGRSAGHERLSGASQRQARGGIWFGS